MNVTWFASNEAQNRVNRYEDRRKGRWHRFPGTAVHDNRSFDGETNESVAATGGLTEIYAATSATGVSAFSCFRFNRGTQLGHAER